ncbi:PREDICTED: pentatricopeptide repeat-containing protein At5g15980, mitochondrial-like [Camelina sativa]|uniref:Pentatricopeptide repeat-containing protein At5g15980, mitochondrial-like n=1 Tax=Camelina sativa TaxID=90675 RepID=A0ABM0T3B5_CAMSA|nr:PREDICTED: pentatricopeptide repeat-containing protein At5g15980, mitochondrial-like [Camelina sativa]
MRYQQWRLLLLRSYHRSHLTYPSPCSQVTSISTRSFSSFIHIRSRVGAFQQSEQLCPLRSPVTTSSGSLLKSVGRRSFSSEPAVEEKPSPEATVIDIFTRLNSEDEIRKELESSDVVISQDLALKVLRKLESNPDVAKRVFQWFKEATPEELTSKSYNMMLRILGGNGLVDEFWGLVDAMKKKGHGLSANVRDKVGEKFQKDGLQIDLVRLKKLFSSDCFDKSAENVCDRVCKIVMKEEWGDDVEKRVRDLNVEFQSDLVKMIVESLDVEPRKALLFFRWIDESGLFKHDEKTYNAVARVLGREKFLDRFQNVVEEMRSAGYEVEIETYVRVSTRFCQTKLIKDAVDLFEIAMVGSGTNKPTPHCLCLLLKKIVTAKVLDMDLFSRAVKAYTRNGNALTDSLLKSILKSLRSADRVEQSNEVLKEMKKGGYVPSSDLQSMIASSLSRKGKKDEADEFVDFMEASGNNLDDKAMASLVEGFCDSGELDEALVCLEKMVEKAGVSYADVAFEKLVLAYCNKNQARDAYKLLSAQVNQNQLKPRHSTYKILVIDLLKKKIARDGGFEEALSLLPIMKDHGYPPFIDPFMNYFSTTGKSTEALGFLKAMTSKNFPSMSVVLRVFETMFKSARHSEAQDLLSLCPNYIRNSADVLELFNSMKPNESAVEKPLAASA